MDQVVERKRVDFTGVVPIKAFTDMLEKIGQLGLVIGDEQGPIRPSLDFLVRCWPCH